MRILLAGGGSGGHVFPLIAVADKIRKLARSQGQSEPTFMFLGPTSELRAVFKERRIAVRSIFAGKFRRYFSLLSFVEILSTPIGFMQAYIHLFLFMPDVVFSKGGYGSVPVVLTAWLFRIPIVMHESDMVPGIANKLAALLAKKIIVAFKDTAVFFPKNKTKVFGNPVRDVLFSISREEALTHIPAHDDKPILFVVGGSQGARQINDLLFLALPDVIKEYEIIHQCGTANYKRMRKEADLQLKNPEERGRYHLYGMLNEQELASAYALASIVVSRSGSGAIFEVAASRTPSILIPYTSSAGGHQEKNAHTYVEAGAALMLEGRNITPHMLVGALNTIASNPEKMREMSRAAEAFSKPKAAEKIAEEILNIIK